eukprot:scaffold20652_cov22-Tisochrysis_lutea.AAC.1
MINHRARVAGILVSAHCYSAYRIFVGRSGALSSSAHDQKVCQPKQKNERTKSPPLAFDGQPGALSSVHHKEQAFQTSDKATSHQTQQQSTNPSLHPHLYAPQVEVVYTVHGASGLVESAWSVDAQRALPAPLPAGLTQ